MMKYKDFTLKARLYDKDGIHEKLTQLGFKYDGEDYQQDYYFKLQRVNWNIEKEIIQL